MAGLVVIKKASAMVSQPASETDVPKIGEIMTDVMDSNPNKAAVGLITGMVRGMVNLPDSEMIGLITGKMISEMEILPDSETVRITKEMIIVPDLVI